MEKLVSIIILNYNDNKNTIECVKSLSRQKYKNFEIILIDNGSKYNSFFELNKELDQFKDIIKLKLIRNERNLYFGAGSNKGIKQAKGDFLCLLNNDVIVEPDFIEQMVDFLENHSDAGMITPKIKYYEDKRYIWNTGASINFKTTRIVENRGYLEFDPHNMQYNKIEQIDFAPGTALFLKRSIIDEIGLIDEIFMMYHEDPDWNLRAQKKGYKSYYVPTTIVYHNVPIDINKRYSLFAYYFLKRNSQIVVWKHAKLKTILIFYFWYCYMIIFDTLYYTIKRMKKILLVQLRSMRDGFIIGIKRRTNRFCRKNLLDSYNYAQYIQKSF